MAKEPPPQRKPANLSVEQMKQGVVRLEQRIEELEAFNVNSLYRDIGITTEALRKKVNSTLQDILGADSKEYEEYELGSFYTLGLLNASIAETRLHYQNKLTRSILQLKALKEVLEERVVYALPFQESSAPKPSQTFNTGKVFIVHGHGHDHGVKDSVARFITKLGLEPVILHEQPNEGRTVIDKFEDHAEADFAIVLFTPDDIGYPAKNPDEFKPRARQNVVLELGYFMGKLGRKRVALLQVGDDIEIPSDYAGVLYLPLDGAGAWKFLLAKEMIACGINIDLNKV
jgi:predicted nucleotide-binding protein